MNNKIKIKLTEDDKAYIKEIISFIIIFIVLGLFMYFTR